MKTTIKIAPLFIKLSRFKAVITTISYNRGISHSKFYLSGMNQYLCARRVPNLANDRFVGTNAALDVQGYPVPEELFDALLLKQKINLASDDYLGTRRSNTRNY
jgi:hypothetical protein